jgi:hypothetical protein
MRGGVFCQYHDNLYGAQCRVRNCHRQKVAGTQACTQHQERWYQHVVRYARQSLPGFTRLLRRSEVENHPWLPQVRPQAPPHDQAGINLPQSTHYFQPGRFYCVETICAPCGVVIAWAKFAKAESPTNILAFLESVYPTEASRPDYVCIDKACLVLRTCVASGSWETWKKTTRFIVDSYHYINHRVQDSLCWIWCNPAPLNGSAPNLVIVEQDRAGVQHYKRAFNTQVWLLVIKVCIQN